MDQLFSLVPSLTDPIDTLPQWTAWLVVCFTVWSVHCAPARP